MNGGELIYEERGRQIKDEGWTLAHDDEHDSAELAMAADAYLYWAVGQINGVCWPEDDDRVPNVWPWSDDWFKPSDDPIRNLVKAGALIAAEIDRLQRAEDATSKAGGGDDAAGKAGLPVGRDGEPTTGEAASESPAATHGEGGRVRSAALPTHDGAVA